MTIWTKVTDDDTTETYNTLTGETKVSNAAKKQGTAQRMTAEFIANTNAKDHEALSAVASAPGGVYHYLNYRVVREGAKLGFSPLEVAAMAVIVSTGDGTLFGMTIDEDLQVVRDVQNRTAFYLYGQLKEKHPGTFNAWLEGSPIK